MRNAGHRQTYLYAPGRDESRHSHTQRMAATIRAIQLTPIGIVSVPTVTWAWLINRRRCPIAKIPKKTLATRNPVCGEFISGLLKVARQFVSHNARALYRTSAERCCLHKYAYDREANEHECRTGRRQHNGTLDQVRADKRGDNDQCPTKDRQQQNCPDNATDDEDDGRVLRVVHKERRGDRRGELSARYETEYSNRDFLNEQCEHRSEYPED